MEWMGSGQKICSFCGEEIPESQRRCPYCGSLLAVREAPGAEPAKAGDANNSVNTVPAAAAAAAMNIPGGAGTVSRNGTYPADRTNTINMEHNGIQGTIAAREPAPQPVPGQTGSPGIPRQVIAKPAEQRQPAASLVGEVAAGKTMGNGLKVFLTVLFTVVPGIGQIAGAITALILMSSDGDRDKRTFGRALLVASLILFAIWTVLSFLAAVTVPMLET